MFIWLWHLRQVGALGDAKAIFGMHSDHETPADSIASSSETHLPAMCSFEAWLQGSQTCSFRSVFIRSPFQFGLFPLGIEQQLDQNSKKTYEIDASSSTRVALVIQLESVHSVEIHRKRLSFQMLLHLHFIRLSPVIHQQQYFTFNSYF